jgi:hypothetical protein
VGRGGWGWVGVAGSSENKANLAQLGLELGLSLAIDTMSLRAVPQPLPLLE